MADDPPKRVIGTPFAAGNPGRPKGARNKLGEVFVKALLEDFETNGIATLIAARLDDPMGYIKTVAGLLPKQITGEDGGAIVQRIERVIIDAPNPNGTGVPAAPPSRKV